MLRADTVKLIAEAPEAHGIFDEPNPTVREVFCTERSIGQREAYEARGIGLYPELKLRLEHSFEYNGEKRCQYQNEMYYIIRTYRDEKDGIELTLQRVDGNAGVLPNV